MRIKRKRLKRLCKRKWHNGYFAGRAKAVSNYKCRSCSRTFGIGTSGTFNGVLHCPFCQGECGMLCTITRDDIINDNLWAQ